MQEPESRRSRPSSPRNCLAPAVDNNKDFSGWYDQAKRASPPDETARILAWYSGVDVSKDLSELERLNIAARAVVATSYLPRYLVLSTILAAFIVFLAIGSSASFGETLAVRIIAAVATASWVGLWLHWRYSIHGLAILFILTLLCAPLFITEPITFIDWGSLLAGIWLLSRGARGLWTAGDWLAAGGGEDFDSERAEVSQWLSVMTGGSVTQENVELQAGSFQNGYATYVILHSGGYWEVARFKNKLKKRLLEFRVLETCSPRISQRASGKVDISFADYTISEAQLSAELREALTKLVEGEAA